MHKRRILGMTTAVFAAALFALTSVAQGPGAAPGGGTGGGLGGMLNPAEMAKAWESQAACVAKSLALNDELAKKLADAYKAARESVTKSAMTSMMGSGAQGGSRGAAFRQAMTDERGKFETAVKGFLDADQTAKTMSSLGSFDFRWDMMVNSLGGLGLDDKVNAEAMQIVAAYVTESSKAREAAGDDREVARAKGAELRSKLESDLGKLLSAEQIAKLKEMPGFRRGGPGGGRQRGGPDTPGAPAAAPGAPAAVPAAPTAPEKPADAKK